MNDALRQKQKSATQFTKSQQKASLVLMILTENCKGEGKQVFWGDTF